MQLPEYFWCLKFIAHRKLGRASSYHSIALSENHLFPKNIMKIKKELVFNSSLSYIYKQGSYHQIVSICKVLTWHCEPHVIKKFEMSER